MPEPPGELVSHNCIPDGFADDQSDSRGGSRRLRVGGGAGNDYCQFLIAILSCGVDHHAAVVHLDSGAYYSAEVRAPMEAVLLRKHKCRFAPNYADREARPLARRREMTVRPARVRMRARKPCTRARRRLFGWKVRLPLATVTTPLIVMHWVQCGFRLKIPLYDSGWY